MISESNAPRVEAIFDIALKAPLAVLSVSGNVQDLLGYTPQDFLSSEISLADLIHPHDADIAERLFSIETPHEPDTFNIRLRHADGRIRCVRGIYRKRSTRGGKVTLRVKLQDARSLWKNPGRQRIPASFRAMLDNTDDFIFFKDRNHVFIVASQNMTTALDPILQGPTLLGQTDYEIFPEKYADIYYRLEKQVFAGASVASEVHESQTIDGRVVWLDNHKYPIKNDNGEIVGLFGVVRDISERIRAQQSLRESDESLKETQRIAGLGSYVLDVRTGKWTSSEVLDGLLGIDKSYERTVLGWTKLIHPEDRATMAAYFDEDVLLKRQLFNREYRIVRQNDQMERWVWGLGRLEFDAAGQLVEMLGTIQDITERKFAEHALRESKELLELFIEHAPVSLSMFDRKMRYLAVNRRCRMDFGLGDREVIGHSHYEILPWIPEPLKEIHRRALAGETIRSADERIERADGTVMWGRSEVLPWRTGDGSIGGTILLTEDITKRKMAELALRESDELLREAQKITGIGSLALNIKTGIWTCTDVLDELLGIDKSFEHSMAAWEKINHPDDRDRIDALMNEAVIRPDKPFDAEHRVIRQSDGAVRWVHGRGRVEHDALGQPWIFRATIQDITERKESELALRESTELLKLFIENAPAALAMLDCEMRILALSSRWLEVYGLSGQEAIGHLYYEILPEIPESWREVHRRALAGEIIEAGESRLQRADGGIHWIKREVRPWRTGDGAVGGIIIFSEDITQEKEAQEGLNLAANVFAQASEGIVISDASGSILEVNEAFTRITGYSRDEVLGKNPRILNSGRQSKEFYADMWLALIETGLWSGEVWNRAKDGKVYAETLTISALRDHSGNTERYIALFSDVTRIKEHDKQLERIANYDVLTGLPNRTLLGHLLSRYLAHARLRNRRIAVVHFNIDNFKAITDQFGRSTGDKLLVAFLHRVKHFLHGSDSLARIAGDDFVAILPDNPGTGKSLHVISQILNAASEPIRVDDLVLQISASAGVTFFPQTEEVDADQLLRQASQALFQAKQEGKNRYRNFDPGLDRSVRNRLEVLENIRKALEANQFVLFYQPKVNMCTGAVIGAEALIRWLHPERGLLPPSEFLPLIEGHSLTIDIGRWVIDSALVQLELWRAMGLDIHVSVNIGAEHLQQPDFVENLAALLKAHPTVAPSSLELEVLESSAIQDVALVSEVISGCKHLGLTCALDDFGTAYATLAHLKRLPVDVLKIDQIFVREMLKDPGDLAIVEGMLGLATAFQCQTVAEGVETVEHGLMLLRLGCPVAQGYAIARPMQARDMPAWLSTWRPDPQWANVLPYDTGNRPVLYANVEHHAWIEALIDFLNGKRQIAPTLDLDQCRFGVWLRGEALVYGAVLHGRGGFLGFRSIDLLHQRIHALAVEVLSLNADGRSAEAMGRIPELHALRDELFEKLSNLLQP